MEYSDQFNKAWSLYPKRKGNKGSKPNSFKKYNKATLIYSHEDIIKSIENYKLECQLLGRIGTEYIKHLTHGYLRVMVMIFLRIDILVLSITVIRQK